MVSLRKWYANEARLGVEFPHSQEIAEDFFEPVTIFERHHSGDGYQIQSCKFIENTQFDFFQVSTKSAVRPSCSSLSLFVL